MGGSDDPSNIIELSIEEHANAHYDLWIKYNKKEDLLAYLGLKKLISKEEILKELCSHKKENNPNYGKIGEKSPNYGKKRTDEQKQKISEALKEYSKNRSEQHKENLKTTWNKDNFFKERGNKVAKKWKIIYPDGKEIIITNISEWCKTNSFPKSSVCCAYKSNRHYKNYFFQKVV